MSTQMPEPQRGPVEPEEYLRDLPDPLHPSGATDAASDSRYVVIRPKPDAVPAVRAAWRTAAEQKAVQLWRLIRVFVLAWIAQVLVQLAASGDVTHLSRSAIVSICVAAAEVVWRQYRPALPAAAVDTAPGATIVPPTD